MTRKLCVVGDVKQIVGGRFHFNFSETKSESGPAIFTLLNIDVTGVG